VISFARFIPIMGHINAFGLNNHNQTIAFNAVDLFIETSSAAAPPLFSQIAGGTGIAWGVVKLGMSWRHAAGEGEISAVKRIARSGIQSIILGASTFILPGAGRVANGLSAAVKAANIGAYALVDPLTRMTEADIPTLLELLDNPNLQDHEFEHYSYKLMGLYSLALEKIKIALSDTATSEVLIANLLKTLSNHTNNLIFLSRAHNEIYGVESKRYNQAIKSLIPTLEALAERPKFAETAKYVFNEFSVDPGYGRTPSGMTGANLNGYFCNTIYLM